MKEKNNVIGIIATEGTIRSNSWEIAIKSKEPKINVINNACPLLAKMAEEEFKTEEVQKALKEYLKPFKNQYVDKLILGCTHYPIFKELIQKELEDKIEIISTSEIVCEYVKELTNERELTNTIDNVGNYKIFLTNMACNFTNIASRLFDIEQEKIYLA